MAKKENLYFKDFIDMIECSCEAAEHLQKSLMSFNPASLPKDRSVMHAIENKADTIKFEMRARLIKEFVPPIDREDIVSLAHDLDNITDKIEDILIRLYMYNIQSIRPDALVLADVVVRCCKALRQALEEFPNYKKSKVLMEKLNDVNIMEEEGDLAYIEAVHRLYQDGGDAVQISVWSKLFDLFEDCCDSCEHVSSVLERVVMKNS